LLIAFKAWCCFLAAMAVSVPAHAKRIALVVGISDYEHSPKLANPGRDAAGMSAALRSYGFEVVQSLNPSISELLQALDQFYAKADGADAALFFFAGHGLQFDGINYILPKDAQLRSETRLKQETIALQDVLAAIEKRAKLALIFLDACRDNPLAEALQRNAKGAGRTAAIARGLAPMSIRNPDTLLVFAAAPGKTASDGVGTNSPFTSALLQNIREPGVEIELMLKRVTRDVVQATNGEQVPERLSRLTSEFVFNRAAARLAPPLPLPTSRPNEAAKTTAPPVPSPSDTRSSCIAIGPTLTGRVQVEVGSRLCAQNPPDFAEVREIGSTWVTYGENNGFNKSCEIGQLCRFGWSGSPLFTVSILELAGGAKSAVLLPRRN
jgi:Caspase domain